jgi:hypothetical protein
MNTTQEIQATYIVDDITGNIRISQENGITKDFIKMYDAVNYCKENNVMAQPQNIDDDSLISLGFQIGLLSNI